MSILIAMKNRRRNTVRQFAVLRSQIEDLNNCLDLLEARARKKGKRTFTTEEVRKQLGLA